MLRHILKKKKTANIMMGCGFATMGDSYARIYGRLILFVIRAVVNIRWTFLCVVLAVPVSFLRKGATVLGPKTRLKKWRTVRSSRDPPPWAERKLGDGLAEMELPPSDRSRS